MLCHPYLSLQYYDLLTEPSVRGFFMGATNVLFKQRRHLIDAVIEVRGHAEVIGGQPNVKCRALEIDLLRDVN